uniref:DUF5641 domain-containing protein n=1 Tax=Trichogramma kaykai TaxID=54128 RepID=A0ABD2W9J2_9HYME
MGNQLFTYEELSTLTLEIGAILNSRPLWPISTDPNDLVALSPAHFLIGKPLTMLPEIDWRLGRVIELHPGDDGVVRVVTLKTSQGVFKRNVRSLCLLPID